MEVKNMKTVEMHVFRLRNKNYGVVFESSFSENAVFLEIDKEEMEKGMIPDNFFSYSLDLLRKAVKRFLPE